MYFFTAEAKTDQMLIIWHLRTLDAYILLSSFVQISCQIYFVVLNIQSQIQLVYYYKKDLPGFCSRVHRDQCRGGLCQPASLLVRRFDTRQNRPWPWPRRRRPCRRRRASSTPRRSRLWSICLNQLFKKKSENCTSSLQPKGINCLRHNFAILQYM